VRFIRPIGTIANHTLRLVREFGALVMPAIGYRLGYGLGSAMPSHNVQTFGPLFAERML
jgi:hypothetical protein